MEIDQEFLEHHFILPSWVLFCIAGKYIIPQLAISIVARELRPRTSPCRIRAPQVVGRGTAQTQGGEDEMR